MSRQRASKQTRTTAAKHLVVDGSNIATEGRSTPSLVQLNEAVRAVRSEYGYERVTVVVDATFSHRIERKESTTFETSVAKGEIITPPAGAIGRGDAFVLQIADKAHAAIFSNDSFQEFHGQYPWLFEEGRLIGGKPVAGVGWIFVLRTPVRGPTSRKSVRDAKATPKEPVKEPKKQERAKQSKQSKQSEQSEQPAKPAKAAAAPVASAQAPRGTRPRRRRGAPSPEPINEQLAYATFVVDHPIGSMLEGEVERFSSHGAYVKVGAARAYVPLKAMGDPPPRRAREVMKLGQTRAFVVDRFDPERRGIDLALTGAPSEKADSGARAAEAAALAAGTDKQRPTAEEAYVSPAAKKAAAKKKATAKKAPAKKAGARKTTAKKKTAAKRAPAKKKATARKATKKRAPAKKRAAAKRAPAKKKATAKRAPARKKATARKTTARKSTARKSTAKRAPARKATKARAAKK